MDTYPHEDIKLASGKIKTIFKTEVRHLGVTLSYNDSMGNEYPKTRLSIDVDDRRSNKDKAFEIPINIDWKTGPITFKE